MRPLPLNTLSPKALPVWRIYGCIRTSLLALIPIGYSACIFFFSFPQWVVWILLGALLLYCVIAVFVMPAIYWRRWRYEVRENEIDLMRGVWIIKRTVIPMTKVQHVDTKQGPILRKYELAVVTITTAATVHEIPSLSLKKADELRDRIAQLAAIAHDE